MCGYCVEIMGLGYVLLHKNHPIDSFSLLFYLQESNFTTVELHGLLKEIYAGRVEEDYIALLNTHILVCRYIEMLLLKNVTMRDFNESTVSKFFKNTDSCEARVDSHSIQTLESLEFLLPQLLTKNEVSRPLLREKLIEAARIFPNIKSFSPLYNNNTLLVESEWRKFVSLPSLLNDCNLVIDNYISWWLNDESLNSLSDEGFELNLPETILFYDSSDETSKENRLLLDFVFRALLFSVIYIGYNTTTTQRLKKIVTRNPIGLPFFDQMDLWLQRISAALVYKKNGLSFFIRNKNSIRIEIPIYLLLKYISSKKERKSLYRNIESFNNYSENEHQEFIDKLKKSFPPKL